VLHASIYMFIYIYIYIYMIIQLYTCEYVSDDELHASI
jgi:hypothetical protein